MRFIFRYALHLIVKQVYIFHQFQKIFLTQCYFSFLFFCECPGFNSLVSTCIKDDSTIILFKRPRYIAMRLNTNAKSTFGTLKSISTKLFRLANNLQQMLVRNVMHLIYGNRIMSDVFRNNSASRQYTKLYESQQIIL